MSSRLKEGLRARKLTRMAFAPFPSRARRFLDASRTGARMQRRALDTGSQSATVSAAESAVGAKVPATLRDPGGIRFWIAVVLTGLCAGLGAALLTLLFDAAQELAWGAAGPSALFQAARQASPQRHIGLLLAAGLATSVSQWLLTRLTSGNSIDVTAAIWFQAGRMPAWRTLGTAVLSIVIVAMGVPLGREGAPKQFGVVFGNLFSSLQKLSDEQRRLVVAIGAGAGMAAVYSVPLGGALFALEVLRGALALRLVVPALAAALIATTTAGFIVPNAPLYTVPLYPISPDVYLWTVIAAPLIGLWSVVFVRAIAWAYRARPSGWGRFIAPPIVLAVIGLVSIVFPELLGNGQDVAQLLFLHPLEPIVLAALVLVRPMATIASVASGAPGGLFTPSLAAGALAGAGLGQLWLFVHPGGDIGLYALLGAGAMLAASTQGPISSLVLMMELTGQARAFALPMLTAIVIATLTARLIEWRSVYEARLTDEEVAERLLAREPRGG
jgi:chloride channel protein, CIC family